MLCNPGRPQRGETTRKPDVRRFCSKLSPEDLDELQQRAEEGQDAFLRWKISKNKERLEKNNKVAAEEMEKYQRMVVNEELLSLRSDITYHLWMMEKEVLEDKRSMQIQEDIENGEILEVLDAGRKHVLEFQNANRREGWNDRFVFGEMALEMGPLRSQLLTPRPSLSDNDQMETGTRNEETDILH